MLLKLPSYRDDMEEAHCLPIYVYNNHTKCQPNPKQPREEMKKEEKKVSFKSITITKANQILLGIQKSNRSLIINLNSTSLLLIAIPEGQLPATLILRRCQPKTHKVATGGRGCMIRVRSAGVQNVRIRQELNITDIKDHVQRQANTGFFQHAQGFLLCV